MTDNKDEQVQLGDGYKCSCGFITDDKKKFLVHVGHGNKQDGKGTHQSQGRVNILTGEITMPPWEQRTKEQQDQSRVARKARPTNSKNSPAANLTMRVAEMLSQATEVKLVPRIYTVTYTPIMQAGLHAAINVFKWREDIPFENFLDTVIYNFFREHGVKLTGYIVDERLLANPASTEDTNLNRQDTPVVENATTLTENDISPN